MLDGRALDCKPKVDVCLQVGSIPIFGICYLVLWERGVTVARWIPVPVVRVQVLALLLFWLVTLEAWRNGNRTGLLSQGAVCLMWVRVPPPLFSYFVCYGELA